MTIDERLERLTERHEALAQSIELLVHTMHESQRKFDELRETNQREYNTLRMRLLKGASGLAGLDETGENE